MRDLVSCISENSINIANPSCSKYNTLNISNTCISPSPPLSSAPSLQTSITNIYRITSKHLLLNVTWSNNTPQSQQFSSSNHNGLSISLTAPDHNPSTSLKLNTSSRFFRKKKGNKFLDSHLGKIEVFWDLSSAKYQGPEPFQSFYVIVLIDAQLALVLGDSAEETLSRKKGFDFNFNSNFNFDYSAKCLVSRQEHFSGNTLYSTRAKFLETGDSHEIIIRCGGETEDLKQSSHCYPILYVCIDKKTVIKVKRLQWNFRGNQTIFLDGLLVDLMWDVHDWFFSNPDQGSGRAVFMFRTRNGMDSSRLWLEEKKKISKKDEEKLDFSLLIYACKTSN